MPNLASLADIAGLSDAQYQQAVVAAALGNHLPAAMTTMMEVPVSAPGLTGSFWTTAMPLTIGTDAQMFHAPLSAPMAQRIADKFSWSLPTKRMVDAIHATAATHVPFHAYSENRSAVSTFVTSSQAIEQRRAGRGGLVSDYAKDYVLAKHRDPSRITIYGGWDASGALVQPFATPHDLYYMDYSQMPRFVAQQVRVNGAVMSLADALANATTAPLFSHEGTITGAMLRY